MKWINIFFIFGAIMPSQVQAQEVSLSAGVSNGYIDNGYVVGELGKVAVQPALSVDVGKLSINASGNAFVQDRDALKDFDEIELSGAYALSLGDLNLSIGLAHELYFVSDSDADESATEVVAGLSVDGLSPVLSVSRNFADGDRWAHDFYVSLSDSRSLYGVNVGVAVAASDVDGWAFDNATGVASIDLPLGEITVSPGVTFVYIDSDTQHLVVGARVSF